MDIYKVRLEFDNLGSLAGFSYGETVFKDFVFPYLDKDKIVVEFPENIERVASAFVQGFISVLGVEEFEKRIVIDGSPSFISKFKERMV